MNKNSATVNPLNWKVLAIRQKCSDPAHSLASNISTHTNLDCTIDRICIVHIHMSNNHNLVFSKCIIFITFSQHIKQSSQLVDYFIFSILTCYMSHSYPFKGCCLTSYLYVICWLCVGCVSGGSSIHTRLCTWLFFCIPNM